MTAAVQQRSFFDVMVGEPLELVKSQPHQVLLSTGSIALMGQFAGTDGIVAPIVGYLIAVGVEWAYLRGLASDSRAQTAWGAILNWSAFGIVVLWGVLWVAGLLHVFDPANGGWALAAAHVVPVAWLSLCSAQCHRAAMAAERREERAVAERARIAAEQAEADRRAWELAQEEEDRKLARWKEAFTLKSELKVAERAAVPARKHARDARQQSIDAEQKCPRCGTDLDPARWRAALRWGHCANCKEATS